ATSSDQSQSWCRARCAYAHGAPSSPRTSSPIALPVPPSANESQMASLNGGVPVPASTSSASRRTALTASGANRSSTRTSAIPSRVPADRARSRLVYGRGRHGGATSGGSAMEMTKYEHGVPSWVDVGVPDLDQAAAFYSGLFGWDCPPGPEEAGGYRVCTLKG